MTEWKIIESPPYTSCLFYIREGRGSISVYNIHAGFWMLSNVAASSLPHWLIQHWHFLLLTLLLCGVFACNIGHKCVCPRGSAWQLDYVAESWLLGIRANASFRILIYTDLQSNYCSKVKLDRDLEKDMPTFIWNEDTWLIITVPNDRCSH